MLANSRQADLIGAKLIQNLRELSGDTIQYSGYGGQFMRKEGFEPTIDFDIDLMLDKTFATYRKTKTINESIFFRWNPMNMVNMHYKRQTDDVYQMVGTLNLEPFFRLLDNYNNFDLFDTFWTIWSLLLYKNSKINMLNGGNISCLFECS